MSPSVQESSAAVQILLVPDSFVSSPGRTIVSVRVLYRRYQSASPFACKYARIGSGTAAGWTTNATDEQTSNTVMTTALIAFQSVLSKIRMM